MKVTFQFVKETYGSAFLSIVEEQTNISVYLSMIYGTKLCSVFFLFNIVYGKKSCFSFLKHGLWDKVMYQFHMFDLLEKTMFSFLKIDMLDKVI